MFQNISLLVPELIGFEFVGAKIAHVCLNVHSGKGRRGAKIGPNRHIFDNVSPCLHCGPDFVLNAGVIRGKNKMNKIYFKLYFWAQPKLPHH